MLSRVPDFKEDARDFPVGPVAKKDVVLSMQGVQVQSLVRELYPMCCNQYLAQPNK